MFSYRIARPKVIPFSKSEMFLVSVLKMLSQHDIPTFIVCIFPDTKTGFY